MSVDYKPEEQVIPEVLAEDGWDEYKLLLNFFDPDGGNQRPFFFPEYTGHGLSHIKKIFEIILHLTDPEWLGKHRYKTLTDLSSDAKKILALGVLYHDIGMYLEFPGFLKLIGDSGNWSERWRKYIQEMKSLSDEKWSKTFGDGKRLTKTAIDGIEKAKTCTDNLKKMVIGEFIRRFHEEISERIVLDGFLDKDGGVLPFYNGFSENGNHSVFQKLVGYLARSHRADLRSFSDEINSLGGTRGCPDGVPIYYLMTLLRIADTLDIGKHRVPGIQEKTRDCDSEISRQEWDWNKAISFEASQWTLNEERRHISTRPESTSVFVRVEKELRKAQDELDRAWAVIGEYYGTDYGMTFRRITSDIDIDYELSIRPILSKSFLTQEALLKVDPNIIASLVEPLYDWDQYCCVRELLQNAVDACNERTYLAKHYLKEKYSPIITVGINRELGELSIKDNGIGMDAEIVTKYFLVAGASIRTDKSWQGTYTDQSGKAKVLRTGKFGIGALSGFLIGDQIDVITRHLGRSGEDSVGYKFSISRDGEQPSDVKCIDAEVGTTIKIKFANPEDIQKFADPKSIWRWTHWYLPNTPKIVYSIDGADLENTIDVGGTHATPIPEFWDYKSRVNTSGCIGYEWHSFELDDFQGVEIFWRLVPLYEGVDRFARMEEGDLGYFNGDMDYGIHCYNGNRLQKGIRQAGKLVRFCEDVDIDIRDPNNVLNIDLARNSLEDGEKIGGAICVRFKKSVDRGDVKKTQEWIREHATQAVPENKLLVLLSGRVWRVLTVKDNKALLISEHVLYRRSIDKKCQNYGERYRYSWGNCTLRAELNSSEWLSKYLKCIDANLLADWYSDSIDNGDDSKCRVFLLSIAQVEAYFAKFILDRKSRLSKNEEFVWWWLRSPGFDARDAAAVGVVGDVGDVGDDVYADNGGVRPAFWLNL
ncbi:MAG: DUF6273 domain-containing protein [Coriobacteriales bacterium]|jgi:hypothetical protein|nr:DUF6273 domain-containing protein [Coriobacteriales bacterium]